MERGKMQGTNCSHVVDVSDHYVIFPQHYVRLGADADFVLWLFSAAFIASSRGLLSSSGDIPS